MGFGGNNWGDPNSMAWLGMAQALGQAAMPSRLPVPNGAVFGALAGGLMQGAKSGYDMKKEQMQTQLYEAQAGEAKRKAEMMPKLLQWLEGVEKGFGGTPADGSAGYATSDTADPGIVPPAAGGTLGIAPAGSGSGRGGWGPLADPAIKALKEAGASDAYIQAQMAHGLAEGGFNTPWQKAGGGENSFGHWQFNAKGELPAYLEWVKAKGGNPQDTAMQALYTMEVNEQRQPGITKTGNAGAAMDAIASNFERYQGHGPGQRRGFLADAQRAMSGGALEPRVAIPAPPGQLAENALPAVPNFAGIMAGNRGASYAPEVAPAENPAPGGFSQALVDAKTREIMKTQGKEAAEAFYSANRSPAAPVAAASPLAGLPPALTAALANASRPAPVNTITPLASGAAPVAPLPTAPGVPAMPIGAPAQARPGGPFLSPQAMALAKIGSAAKLLGFGDIAQPWETAYYGSPAHKAAVAAAETNARETAGFRFIGPKAQAEASGKVSVTEPSEIRVAKEKQLLEQQLAEVKSRLDTTRALAEKGQRVNPTTGEIEDIPGAIKTGAAAEEAKTKAVTSVTAPIEREKQILQAALDQAKQENAASFETTTIRIGDQEFPVTKKQYADIVSRGGVPGQGGTQSGGALSLGRNIPAEELRAGQTKARIAIDAKAAEAVGEHATLARRLIPLIDEVVRRADATPQGWAGPVAASAARGFSAFGISVAPGLTNAELLESVSRQLIPLVREPGATSERELANYLKAVPGLMQSSEGRKKIAGMMKSVMQGSIDIADVYRDNIGSPDLKEKLATLADERRAKLDREVFGGGNFKEGDIASSPGKPDLIMRGGKWVPMK